MPESTSPGHGTPPGVDPTHGAVAFVRLLRQAGLDVPVDATARFAAALDVVDVADPVDVYWAARTTLIRRQDDGALFDLVFAGYFGATEINVSRGDAPRPAALAIDDDDRDSIDDGQQTEDRERETIQVRFSRVETLRHADFATLDDRELAEAWRLVERLRVTGARRESRRRRRAPRGRLDLSRTVRSALRTAGEPISRPTTRHGERFRRVVLLVDVSGSMEPYARALLRFAHAAVSARSRVDAFALGTRLTRLTRELSQRDPDQALARAAEAIADFSGGTRLGDGLRLFNDEWGVRGMARGAVVVILSDGWDRGDPDVLGEQMQRLSRVAHTVVWVNPLKASPGFAPLARGMAAALPHVDHFVEGHSVDALERLSSVLAGEAP